MKKKLQKHKAFTLAEVLITLGIIGVVAALTIPALINRNEERVRETQLKKAYSVLAQVHQMMIVNDIYPYPEFVKPFVDDEEENNPSNPGSGDGGNEQPDIPPVNPNPPVNPDNPGGGEENPDPTRPDINDKKTKELVDGLIEAVFKLDFGTARNNFQELVGMYGLNNLGPFIKDYANQSGIELPGWLDSILGNGMYSKLDDNTIKAMYKRILAEVSQTASNDEAAEKFVRVKQYQLQVLKGLLNGAGYCESYDKCSGGTQTVTYMNLKGTAARIEAAQFENNALKFNDGMYLWLGDINNPQRYFVDINGSKRPNKLGVDVFTFDITPKDTIAPEKSGNCTASGNPTDGEEYRGLGCAGYALTDHNPDTNLKGYWKNFK